MPYPELLSGSGPPPGVLAEQRVPHSARMSSEINRPQASQGSSLPADSSSQKLTRGTSCVLCQQRKVRCDKNKPCANCVKAGVECRVIPPQPPRRRKKRLQEKDLIDRIKKYENLLSDHGVKFDAISQDLKGGVGGGAAAGGAGHDPMDDVEDLDQDFEGLKTTPSASASPSAASQAERERTTGKNFGLHKEFRASERMFADSSEEEAEVSNIHSAFDKMFSAQDGFPFMVAARYGSVTQGHPSTVHMFQLWQIYIDNINPLLKITHIPTVQPQFIEAASRLERAPKNIEALMFAIYIMAITSLEEDEVQARFYEQKETLLGRYFVAVQQALVNADFMKATDAITLQAFFLYLMAVRWYIDPRQVFCLLGVLIRVAQRIGLHRDPGGYGLPPFEVEQRRRLWWAIVGYDRRMGEITGSTVSALSTGGDCKPPLNVNDSDLHIDGKEMPAPHAGPTEMLFALTRIELAMAVSSNSNRDSHKMNSGEKPGPGPKDGKAGGATIRLAGQDGPDYTLDGFFAHIEGTYLRHCDPKIPLHFFTLTMTRQALCKMRVIGFLVRMHDDEAIPLEEVERDNLFVEAIQMIEYDNVVLSSESLQAFKWYTMHYFPFPAYMFLVNELRNRMVGPAVERAWDAITKNHVLRGLLNKQHNPMHVAFGGLFIKAWAAHEEASRNSGKEVEEPEFITVLRDRAAKTKRARAENRNDPSLEQRPVNFPPSDRDDASSTRGSVMSPSERPPYSNDVPPAVIASTVPPVVAGPSTATAPGQADAMDWSYMMMDTSQFARFGGNFMDGHSHASPAGMGAPFPPAMPPGMGGGPVSGGLGGPGIFRG